jgi:[CysO sulfur-carrier protein]-S-L-cysteine hydrolase
LTNEPSSSHADPVRLDSRLFRQMIDHVVRAQPSEGCGLIAFHGALPVKIYPGTNIHSNPADHYRMDDNEVVAAVNEMDRHGWWLGAIYHSHPNSEAYPSSTDVREANWPDALMIIVSLRDETPQVGAFRLIDGTPHQVQLDILPERASWIHTLRDRVNESILPRGIIPPHLAASMPGSYAASGSEQFVSRPQESPASRLPRRATVGILGGMGPLATADL